jgi:uncharacterized protein DUF4238
VTGSATTTSRSSCSAGFGGAASSSSSPRKRARSQRRLPRRPPGHKDLYKVVSTTGEHDGVIEGFFALAENFAKEALDGLVRDGEELSDRDRGDLAFLVAIQEQRALGFLEEFKIGLKQAAIAHLAVELANTKGKKRERALEAYESLVSGGVEIVPPDQEVLRMATEALGETSQLINFLPWTLLKAKSGSLFVSSDRPLTMYDMTPTGPWAAPAWQSSPYVEATLPLGVTSACGSDRASGSAWGSSTPRSR